MTLLVVGLGNPGAEYAATRHNIGFRVVDELAARAGSPAFRRKFHGELADARVGGKPALLLKPLTYMNESGQSVRAAVAFYKIDIGEVLVIHDELDLPFGQIRLKPGGGDAGNRGIRSISGHLGTGDYARLRFGIGKPPPGFRGGGADFVLQGFAPQESSELARLIERAADAAELVAAEGLQAAMNKTHRSTP
ncbi:MAG TPA: aminoacyl-tRNA hydrolase [Polyangiaceae bacterium]